jgi:tetratricopeptide (TPR) repeat protein
LIVDVDPRSPERGQYAFVQALIREVAYGTLARRERKARHLAAARNLEGLGSDELAGALAGHYLAAHANAAEGPEADALAGQARLALRGAAERAAALGSHDQAVTFLQQALTVTADPGEEADLLDRAGVEATAAAHYAAAEDFLRQALQRRRAAEDAKATAWTLTLLARALLGARRPERALELLEPAVEELRYLAPDLAFVALEGQLGRALMLHDEHRRALEVLERVLEAAEHADLQDVLADALVTRGSALCALGRLQEGLGVIEIGERLARANGLSVTVMRAINNRAGSLFEVDLPATIELCRDGMALARRVGDRGSLFSLAGLLGWSLQISGDLDDALASFEAGLADEPEPADGLVLLDGVIFIRATRGELVDDKLAELERLAAGLSDWNVIWTTVDAPAWVAFCEGRLDDAARRWREGAARNPATANGWLQQAAGVALLLGDAQAATADLAALDASGFHSPFLELQRRRIRAGLAALDGRKTEAARAYRDVLGEMHARGYAWDHALACIEMVTLVGPSAPEVVAAAAVARATLERVHATPFLERLDAALERPAGEPARSGTATATAPDAASDASVPAS